MARPGKAWYAQPSRVTREPPGGRLTGVTAWPERKACAPSPVVCGMVSCGCFAGAGFTARQGLACNPGTRGHVSCVAVWTHCVLTGGGKHPLHLIPVSGATCSSCFTGDEWYAAAGGSGTCTGMHRARASMRLTSRSTYPPPALQSGLQLACAVLALQKRPHGVG